MNPNWTKITNVNWPWISLVRRIFEKYRLLTEGSEIQIKQGGLVFAYDKVEKELGNVQSK